MGNGEVVKKYTQVRASLETAQRIRDMQIRLVAVLNEIPNQDGVIGLALDALGRQLDADAASRGIAPKAFGQLRTADNRPAGIAA